MRTVWLRTGSNPADIYRLQRTYLHGVHFTRIRFPTPIHLTKTTPANYSVNCSNKSKLMWEFLHCRGKICDIVGIFAILWENLQCHENICNIVRKSATTRKYLQYRGNIFNAVKISAMTWEYLQYFEKIWNVVGKLAILPKNKIVTNLPMTYNKSKEDIISAVNVICYFFKR